MDSIATLTPDEYRTVRAQLQAEGLWDVAGDRSRERHANHRAEQILVALHRAELDAWGWQHRVRNA